MRENETGDQVPPTKPQTPCLSIYRPRQYQQAPPPHKHQKYITHDTLLFEEMHMGVAVVDVENWRLVVDGMVENPISLSLPELRKLPKSSITAFHECYGSPLRPSDRNIWRVGNVTWSGVRLKTLLEMARPTCFAQYVWSDGLDHGVFAGQRVSCYQKDLPLEKAMSDEVLVAYEMNSEPLRKERGGPARLIVPGWFGTNSTKWLCRISLQEKRAPGIFATYYYNRPDPKGELQPVWKVEPNSMITEPSPNAKVAGPTVVIRGWAWSWDGIEFVLIRLSSKQGWQRAEDEATQGLWLARILPCCRATVWSLLYSCSSDFTHGRGAIPGEPKKLCARVDFEVISVHELSMELETGK